MYFVKARKHLEEQDASESPGKSRRERYQRSDSARLVLQAVPSQQPSKQPTDDGQVVPTQSSVSDQSSVIKGESSVDYPSDFKPEELPDGACYRPKKDLKNLSPPVVPTSEENAGYEQMEQVRPAEYIGTFSVSGSDKEARERQMESQLEQMRTAKDRRPVNLLISTSGVKVLLQENNNVFMDHSLKRIWYATCDPEYCQFSFLAREPKTSAEVQYCHAFVTQSPEQAEELIAIIGEAFKSTYTESKKQPTFHELIEQQVQQQQAKFREIEKEAKNALQQKLKEIATPTPFSERAQFRMEQRRKSEDVELVVGGRKHWAKQLVESQGVKHAPSPDRNTNNIAGNRRSEIPTRQPTPQVSPFKRNSVPQAAVSSHHQVPSSSPPAHPLSAMAIKESVETRSSNSKFKGSPVTALKNEIDRRLSMAEPTDIADIHPTAGDQTNLRKDQGRQPAQNAMANRPLPLPPDLSLSPQRSRHMPQRGGLPLQQQSQPLPPQHLRQLQQPAHGLIHQRSLDDYHLPRSSSAQVPLSSNARNGGVANVKMRDSPKRKQARPMSEIATSCSGAAGTTAGGGSDYYQQQRQSLLNNFAASFNLPPHLEGGNDGMYIYGPSPQDGGTEEDEVDGEIEAFSGHQQERGRNFNRRAGAFSKGEIRNGRSGGEIIYNVESIRPVGESSQHKRQNHYQAHPANMGQGRVSPTPVQRLGNPPGQGLNEPAVPRYQNDSPFQNDRPEKGSKPSPGLESLMHLDRSHIHDQTLRNTTWYQAGLPREIALEILQQEEVGSFIVRDSSTHPGCYALSVRVPKYENASGISHYLILRTHRGVKLKGLDKEWSTLTALVTHHTVMREMLPCTLRLPKVKGQGATSSFPEGEGGGGGSGHDGRPTMDSDNYNQLSEVAGLVANLKM